MKAAAKWYDLFINPPWKPSWISGQTPSAEDVEGYFVGLPDGFTLKQAAAHMEVTSRETVHNRIRIMISSGRIYKERRGRLMYFHFIEARQ